MKTIIKRTKDKTAQDMALILGITERAVTYRVKSIRRREYDLNKQVFNNKISMNDAAKIMSDFHNKWLPGYNYEVKGTTARPTYSFYKNV